MLRSCLERVVHVLRGSGSAGEAINGYRAGFFGAVGSVRHSRHEREWSYRTLPKADEGTVGETTHDIDAKINRQTLFPDEVSHLRLFDGVPFNQLPIVEIKVTKNNTIMTLCNSQGVPQIIRSCGIEGFKHARKGTNIAAQATSISFSNLVLDRGIKTVRVRIQGIGPGRMASIKGLQMGGMNVISITDATRVSWNPPRPRKARRL